MKNLHKSHAKMVLPLLMAVLLTACEHNPGPIEDTGCIFLNNQCTQYFFNMTQNFPLNTKGSCGYAAACALLEYYDIYFDDTIVDSKYELRNEEDKSSPGLVKMEYAEVKDLDNYQYYKYLVQNQEKYLQAFLIVQVNEHWAKTLENGDKQYFFYHFNSDSPCTVGDGYLSHFSNGECEVQVFMNYYLQDLMGFDKDYIHVDCLEKEWWQSTRSVIIKKVKQGIPVFVSARKNKSGHRCIIYDYDEEENELYANLMQMDNLRHVKVSLFSDELEYPLVISTK